MKNSFLVFERHRTKDGKLFLDDDGAIYLKPHSNKIFQKEFVNELEVHQAIQDARLAKTDPVIVEAAAKAIRAGDKEAGLELLSQAQGNLTGEIIILNVIEL